jgi:curli biogenesis system outer membrane secretion channel CsgG
MQRFFFLLLLFCTAGIVSQTKNGNSAVAVLDFQKTGSITNDDVQTLSNRFRAMLFQTKTFNVVERQKMKEILTEQEFILSDECSTNECAVQVGQLLGVEYMIAGDIGLIGDTYTIDLRMIDVSTGQLVQTHSKDYDGKIAGLLEIMKQIANSFSQFQKEASKMMAEEDKEVKSSSAKEEKKETIKEEKKTETKSKELAIRLLIGNANPSGKFSSVAKAKSGSNIMFSCSFPLTPRFQVGIDLGAQAFKSDLSGGEYKIVPFLVTGRFYTFMRKVKNYVSLGIGTTKISYSARLLPDIDKTYATARIGTGLSYEFIKKLSAEMTFDVVNIGSKDKLDYNTTYTQFGLGINYTLVF